MDLGTGGGVPGLILALARPSLAWIFVETQERRARWLEDAIRRLELDSRVEVRWERAEVTGRGPWRGAADAVTARSFGAPPVTAECGAPLLRPGASLWVAEPPQPTAERWPATGLAELGLVRGDSPAAGWVRLEQRGVCPDRFPRRPGLPAKRPLF